MASDPDEIMIDDIIRPRKTETCTTVHLPADCDSKTSASVWVNVDTRTGGNVMPLRVFEGLYPKQMNLNDEPTGLETGITKLTVYNGIPQYGVLKCLLIWRPGNGANPRMHPDKMVCSRHARTSNTRLANFWETESNHSQLCSKDYSWITPNYWIRNHIWLGMMVPHYIQWHRLMRVDIYLKGSNLIKITQIASKEMEDFLEPTRYS